MRQRLSTMALAQVREVIRRGQIGKIRRYYRMIRKSQAELHEYLRQFPNLGKILRPGGALQAGWPIGTRWGRISSSTPNLSSRLCKSEGRKLCLVCRGSGRDHRLIHDGEECTRCKGKGYTVFDLLMSDRTLRLQ